MLNPVPMVRLKAVFLARDERAALQSLGELGLLHLIRSPAGLDTAPLEPPSREQDMRGWDLLLERIKQLRRTLGVPKGAAGPMEDPAGSLQAMEARAAELLARREELRQRREQQAGLAACLQPYRDLDVPMDRIGEGSFLHLTLGTLPEGSLAALPPQALVLPLTAVHGRLPLLAVSAKGDQPSLESALRAAGFQEAPMPPGQGGSLGAAIRGFLQEVEEAVDAGTRLEAEIQSFSEEIAGHLAGMEEWAGREKRLLEARDHCPGTDTTFLLQGWVPASDLPVLEGRLRSATGGYCVLEASPPETGEASQVPVCLRPSPLLRPFELLVANFGLPGYLEISPTPFMAVSYLLMFGMMFGDVGHGLALALAGFLARRRWPDASFLLLGGGLSGAIFGAIYGSCFGLRQFKIFALWHDPLEGDPIHLMTLAIGLGVLMISLGLVLNILNRFRRRDVLGAFMGRFGLAGLLFYWGTLGFILGRGVHPRALPALLLVPVLAWVIHARGAGITDALVETFETLLVYLANTISFVRLAAYAMSHAALLAATFLTADAMPPPLSWLVIILGNLAAVLLEGVIASVQALRLEYYEFFGKFFSGAGRPFQPFRLDVKEGGA